MIAPRLRKRHVFVLRQTMVKLVNLLNEVEHDERNYQGGDFSYLPKSQAEADNKNRGFDNSSNHTKTKLL